jgi:hypothetical protein
MCLIVDANVATQVFTSEPGDDFRPLWEALRTKRAVAVHGGQLTSEYMQIKSILRLLIELARQGVLRKIPDEAVCAATAEYSEQPITSDDPHILGLAKVSGVRLLCSHDQYLHSDFTNPSLLRPKGAVYQTAAHRHLITKHCRGVRRGRHKSTPRKKR